MLSTSPAYSLSSNSVKSSGTSFTLAPAAVTDFPENKPIEEPEDEQGYFNIGEKKLRQLTEGDRCPFVLYCGSKRLIKREMFQSYLEKQFSI